MNYLQVVERSDARNGYVKIQGRQLRGMRVGMEQCFKIIVNIVIQK